jgi:hypothetical protein
MTKDCFREIFEVSVLSKCTALMLRIRLSTAFARISAHGLFAKAQYSYPRETLGLARSARWSRSYSTTDLSFVAISDSQNQSSHRYTQKHDCLNYRLDRTSTWYCTSVYSMRWKDEDGAEGRMYGTRALDHHHDLSRAGGL